MPATAQGFFSGEGADIMITLLIVVFSIPIICKIYHVVRIQVNKIRNADIFGGTGDAEYVEDEED